MFEIIAKYMVPAFLTGGVAGAWLQWLIEKRRKKLDYRTELVKTWRSELIPLVPTAITVGGTEPAAFTKTAVYASLRPHLTKDEIGTIEAEGPTIRIGRDIVRRTLIAAIARIERKWKLV